MRALHRRRDESKSASVSPPPPHEAQSASGGKAEQQAARIGNERQLDIVDLINLRNVCYGAAQDAEYERNGGTYWHPVQRPVDEESCRIWRARRLFCAIFFIICARINGMWYSDDLPRNLASTCHLVASVCAIMKMISNIG